MTDPLLQEVPSVAAPSRPTDVLQCFSAVRGGAAAPDASSWLFWLPEPTLATCPATQPPTKAEGNVHPLSPAATPKLRTAAEFASRAPVAPFEAESCSGLLVLPRINEAPPKLKPSDISTPAAIAAVVAAAVKASGKGRAFFIPLSSVISACEVAAELGRSKSPTVGCFSRKSVVHADEPVVSLKIVALPVTAQSPKEIMTTTLGILPRNAGSATAPTFDAVETAGTLQSDPVLGEVNRLVGFILGKVYPFGPLHFVALINPKSGKGNGVAMWQKYALGVLKHTPHTTEAIVTKSRGHAEEIVEKRKFGLSDVIVVVGGDGLLFEVRAGLDKRMAVAVERRKTKESVAAAAASAAASSAAAVASVLTGGGSIYGEKDGAADDADGEDPKAALKTNGSMSKAVAAHSKYLPSFYSERPDLPAHHLLPFDESLVTADCDLPEPLRRNVLPRIATFPAGSGCAVACNLDIFNALHASFALVRCRSVNIDLFHMEYADRKEAVVPGAKVARKDGGVSALAKGPAAQPRRGNQMKLTSDEEYVAENATVFNPSNAPVKTATGFLSLHWAFGASVDIDSETYRFLGDSRFVAYAVKRIIEGVPNYRLRVRVKLAPGCNGVKAVAEKSAPFAFPSELARQQLMQGRLEPPLANSMTSSPVKRTKKSKPTRSTGDNNDDNDDDDDEDGCDAAATQHRSAREERQARQDTIEAEWLRRLYPDAMPDPPAEATATVDLPEPDADGWVSLPYEDYVSLLVCNLAWIGPDMYPCPYVHPNDGTFDVMFAPGGCSRMELIDALGGMENGTWTFLPITRYLKCTAIEVLPQYGRIVIDGELFPFCGMRAYAGAGSMRIVCNSRPAVVVPKK